MRKYIKIFITIFIYITAFMGLIEATVRVGVLPDLTRLPQPKLVTDPYLGHRFEPNQPELDSNGWRNVSVPDRVDIVSIGDSQTWGRSAPRSLAYPQQLGKMLNKTVYNMAMGGYGPVEYAYLLEQSLIIHPQIVTIGLYFGNDFVECYWASEREPWRHLQRPDFDYESHSFTPSTGSANDKAQPVSQLEHTSQTESNKSWQDSLQPIVFRSKAVVFLWYRLFRDWFIDDYERFKIQDRVYKQLEETSGNQQAVVSYEGERIYMQLTPRWRGIAQDTNDPVVAEGFRICSLSLTNIQHICEDNDLLCLFVLIPTKELVYAPYLVRSGFKIKGYYADLVRFENANRAAVIALLNSLNAHYVDMLSPMQSGAMEAAESGELLYLHSPDGHPNGRGYCVIAEEIAKAIKRCSR